ncbi:N-terminal acetyltransferase B complex subunit arm1 [Sphaceloma murrayae]|uniref:protein O-GlcNAc transferase n=1 Tax=Sphaceloma murrayae TaxID=2082308 RepID=A0A2K1R169_9PEZI|nr:N-terminal acetyltransferase B complex subunit arm1 [Sphaceloma murrayae]
MALDNSSCRVPDRYPSQDQIPGWNPAYQTPAWTIQNNTAILPSNDADGSARARMSLHIPPGFMDYSASFSTPYMLSAENSLRRKTPAGTFNAGFQSSLYPPTNPKQLVTPAGGLRPACPMPFNSPTYDSMMYQAQGYQHEYVNPLFQGGATVIQHAGQPHGPTAPGLTGKGPYGPYWHDGTYIPYRAHAVRDPRYYIQPSHSIHGSPLLLNMQQTFARPPLDASTMRAQYLSRSPPNLLSPQPFTGQPAHYSSPAYLGTSIPPSPSPLPFAEPMPEAELASANAQDRERIFNLALQTYRELLAFLEQVRKTNSQIQHGHTNTRPGIYPKPPASSTGHSPVVTPDTPRPASSPQDSSFANRLSTHYSAKDATQACADEKRSDDPSRLQTNSNANAPDPPVFSRHHSYPNVNLPNPSPALQFTKDRSTIYRRSSSSTIAGVAAKYAAQNTAVPRATNALSTLSQLCRHTGWQWIDGLNLSGCLAYGLGDHQKALDLYNRVLTLDPRHIEAAANLAATLLALGRKAEAEQLWSKAVKQAPSYFEAVEHLVGLLCSSGRSAHAVKVIDFVERSLRVSSKESKSTDYQSDVSSMASRSPCISELSDKAVFDYDGDGEATLPTLRKDPATMEPGFSSSGYSIPGCDNGRMLALVHAKGNMLYSQGDNSGAARAFEDVVLIASGRKYNSIRAVVRHVLDIISAGKVSDNITTSSPESTDPILLHPEQAVQIAKLCFPDQKDLPGLSWLPHDPSALARKSAILTTSNSLLSLAKIFQDGMATSAKNSQICQMISGVREILALYYLSLSLQPSPSTANNVGILLAGVQQSATPARLPHKPSSIESKVPGVVPGSGIALALAYYNYGLVLDSRHAHLYTNLGSLLKDIGQLDAAIEMYKRAVQCDGKFDIALANLANAVKDKGRISEAIDYYNRAVEVNPDFAEAVCGLANALNSVCRWKSRGGIALGNGAYDRWHVDDKGMLVDPAQPGHMSSGWIKRVVDIVEKQLADGEDWGFGTLTPSTIEDLILQVLALEDDHTSGQEKADNIRETLASWSGQKYEGARLVRLVERLTKRVTWRWYQDKYIRNRVLKAASYRRPQLPAALTVPPAPTVLPFHTFTSPLSARQVRLISQRNGYRISASTLKSPWLGSTVFSPPAPPSPSLKIGYVSSDFNNHPLAHLMQSVFGMHDPQRVEAYCYATTASDESIHRQQIEKEAPHFHDASTWSTEKLVQQIVRDGIHILVNLNGYTRGARNEVFAARPAPIQMSFMGFAGTLGAEWCDYIFADSTSIPAATLRPWRRNIDITDQLVDGNSSLSPSTSEPWVYGENIIFSRSTFFCCDHRQSAPDSSAPPLSWPQEVSSRLAMRKQLFPGLPPETVIFANFNQLYKIDPSTFRSWLRILSRLPNAILWLLRFPDLGEANLLRTATQWAGQEVASRVMFTDVAPKNQHIARAKVVDLFLDTPECNAHTTAADVLWSGTPILTWPRYEYKMCSRMAASILKGALPDEGRERAEAELIACSEEDYEGKAVKLGGGLRYPTVEEIKRGDQEGKGEGRLMELRKSLTEARWTSRLFDTRRWVGELEDACEEVWRRWVEGRGGDVDMSTLPKGRQGALP